MNRNIKRDLLCMVVTFIVIVPLLIYSGKSLPAVDDFAVAGLFASANGEWERFSKTVTWVYQYYFSYGGIWFAALINGIFEPYSRFGLAGIRIFNVVANLSFFLSLFCFIHVFVKRLLNVSASAIWPLYCLFVIMIVNGHQNSDVWTWYTGVTVYLLPIAIMFCVFSCFILAIERDTKFYLLPAIGAFCVSGTSLNIAALNCGVLLLLAGYTYTALGKKKEGLVVFGAAFLGALFNTVAPGNYVRHSMMTGDSSVLTAIKNTFLFSIKLLGDRISFSPYLVIFILIFLGAVVFIDFRSIKINFNHPWIAAGVVFLGQFVVNFPVCFGYGSRTPHPRCVFVNDVTLYVLSLFWVIYYAGYMKTKDTSYEINWRFSKYLIVFLLLVTTGLMGTHGGMEKFTTGYMIRSVFDGSFDAYIRHEEGILGEIQASADPVVLISREERKANIIMKPLGVTNNPDDMGNKAIASFFRKESVQIKYNK